MLDTWFSSALWPFSTLGWPEKTPDLARFYPTTALITAYEIIFFWVARMIMMGLEFMGEVPFRDIYITGLVRDKQGRKMSKSLGNGVDPLEIIDEYGADALKFTMAFLAAQGQDVLFDKEAMKLGSRFANKIWNASRYLLMNLEGRTLLSPGTARLTDIDAGYGTGSTTRQQPRARRSRATGSTRQPRPSTSSSGTISATGTSRRPSCPSARTPIAEKDRIVTLLLELLEESLRLAHPFLPLITEEIYQTLPGHTGSIMTRPYPVVEAAWEHPDVEARFALLQDLVRAIRTIRAEFTVPPDRKVDVIVTTEEGTDTRANLQKDAALVTHLAGTASLTFAEARPGGGGIIAAAGRGFEVFVVIREAIDAPKEIARLTKDREKTESEIRRTKDKLANTTFVERAPREVVDREKEKLAELGRLVGEDRRLRSRAGRLTDRAR